MFTGIVQSRQPLAEIVRKEDFATFIFDFPPTLVEGLQIGASVAINGTSEGTRVSFDAIGQTLKVTNLGALEAGSIVNIERAARFGDEIGGHAISGHVMDQVAVTEIIESENNLVIWMERPEHLAAFILDKGYVALNGCS
ncbi:MAG: riboflavin synthase, partial [Thalassolituus sp.]